VPKLPAPIEPDLAKGVLESIDMESYRVEARSTMAIALADEDKEIDPVPGTGGGKLPEPELDQLSNIVKTFNEQFGNIEWEDKDKIRQVITEEIPQKVAQNQAYQNAIKNNDKQNARLEHDKVLGQVIAGMMKDHMELFRQFSDNPSFRKWLGDSNFNTTYNER
jgi:type I restriction enzyme R subunit